MTKQEKSQKRTVMDELLVHEHHEHHHSFVLHPYGIRRYWDIVTTLAVLYLCWRIPFDVGIDWWYPPAELKRFELFLDIWFGVDILLNFRTGFVHNGHLVMDPKEIAKHYFEFWFWIDIIATIPFELFGTLFESKSSRKAIKLVKWFKIPRLMRLGRVLKYLRQYAKFYSLILVTGAIILSVHMFGCIFVAAAQPCAEYVYDKKAGIDDSKYGPCAQKNAFKVWSRALHYGMAMLLGNSVRSMDGTWDSAEIRGLEFHHNISTDLMSLVFNIIGLLLVAMFFGEIAVISHHGDSTGWDFRVRLKRLRKEMELHGLPEDLQHRVNKYYDYLWMNHLHGKNALLEDPDMSKPLKHDISLFLYRNTLASVPFLRRASPDVVGRLCKSLIPEVYMPGEYIFHSGDRGRHLYIVTRGTASVLNGDSDVELTELKDNSFFGEMAILKSMSGGNPVRNSSVRAKTICQLLSLSADAFIDISMEFPSFREEMLALSAKRRSITMGRKPSSPVSSSASASSFSYSQGAGGNAAESQISAAAVEAAVQQAMIKVSHELELSINDRFNELGERLHHAISSSNGALAQAL